MITTYTLARFGRVLAEVMQTPIHERVHSASANLEERNDIWGLDDRWGGSSKGNKQAKKWVQRSYRLWKQWTGYLVEYSLRPFNQRMLYILFLPARVLTQISLHG